MPARTIKMDSAAEAYLTVPNRLTRKFREAIETVYRAVGGDAAFAGWARRSVEQPDKLERSAINVSCFRTCNAIAGGIDLPRELRSIHNWGMAP